MRSRAYAAGCSVSWLVFVPRGLGGGANCSSVSGAIDFAPSAGPELTVVLAPDVEMPGFEIPGVEITGAATVGVDEGGAGKSDHEAAGAGAVGGAGADSTWNCAAGGAGEGRGIAAD